MKLIVITPEQAVINETSIVNRLFENGLQRLHVRRPSLTVYELRTYIGAIAPEYHQYLVLNSHFDLLGEFNTGGVHLNSFARNDERIQALVKGIPAGSISTSFHSWQEIADNRFQYGYVFISPVFDSVSKPGYMAGIDLAETSTVKNQLVKNEACFPLIIGLGGVTAGNIGTLYKYGFDGAAMLGNIWQAIDPVSEFRKVVTLVQSLKGG